MPEREQIADLEEAGPKPGALASGDAGQRRGEDHELVRLDAGQQLGLGVTRGGEQDGRRYAERLRQPREDRGTRLRDASRLELRYRAPRDACQLGELRLRQAKVLALFPDDPAKRTGVRHHANRVSRLTGVGDSLTVNCQG